MACVVFCTIWGVGSTRMGTSLGLCRTDGSLFTSFPLESTVLGIIDDPRFSLNPIAPQEAFFSNAGSFITKSFYANIKGACIPNVDCANRSLSTIDRDSSVNL
jgi:hypothetical protein